MGGGGGDKENLMKQYNSQLDLNKKRTSNTSNGGVRGSSSSGQENRPPVIDITAAEIA